MKLSRWVSSWIRSGVWPVYDASISSRRVDVEADVLLRLVGLEVDHLGHDQVCHLRGDRGAQEDDADVQEPRVDVERALAAAGLFDHHGNHGRHRLPPV